MNSGNLNPNQLILMNSEELRELIRDMKEVKGLLSTRQTKNDFPQLLRTSEVKKLLKIGESTLATLRQNGSIPFTKVGGTIYFLKEDLKQIIQNNYSGTDEIKL